MNIFNNMENIKIRTKIIMIVFVLYTSAGLICTWTEYQNIFPFLLHVFYGIQIIIIPILLILFFASNPNLFDVIAFFFCLLVGVIATLKTRKIRFLMFLLFFWGARNINYEYVIKHNVKANIGIFLFIIISSFFKILPNITWERTTGLYRQSWGFSAPNLLILAFMIIVMQLIIVKKRGLHLLEAAILIGIAMWIGKISDGRGGEISIILGILLVLLINVFQMSQLKKFFSSKIRRYFLIFLPEIFCLFIFLLVIMVPYGSDFYNKLNTLFSFRLDIARFYFESTGIHLLPVKVTAVYLYPWSNVTNIATVTVVDNLYMQLICFLGIIATVIFLMIYSVLINNAIKNEDYWLLIVLIVFLFLGLVESQMIAPFVGIFAITYSNYRYKEV